MEDIIQYDNQIYIKASSTLADQRTRVIKQGDLFAIYDVYGDIKPVGTGAQGLYREATRFLSQFEMRVGGRYALFLSSSINGDATLFTADLSNPDMKEAQGTILARGTFHIFRSKFLSDDSNFERIQISNFGNESKSLEISFRYNCDFADMFEIRGIARSKRGNLLPPQVSSDSVLFQYDGLDHRSRFCKIQFHPCPAHISASGVSYKLDFHPGERTTLYVTTACLVDKPTAPLILNYHSTLSKIERERTRDLAVGATVLTSNGLFNAWLNRSKSDVMLMETDTPDGRYPNAGIPWFNTVFGRDGIITALEYMWMNHDVAKGVLNYLSRHQAKEDRPDQDAEPGKILHEFRKGEMVDTGEVPFKNYYGSVDSTPLFLCLAGSYYEATADHKFLEEIFPAIDKALLWINKYGDQDGDGFVEYFRRSPNGLTNQGWKDSHDSISHADGTLAKGPIALCEVQGYVYEGKIQVAKIARAFGKNELAHKLESEARSLREKFREKFWDSNMGLYALALDGDKRPCSVRSSNAGQCLFSGIAFSEDAKVVSDKLFTKDMFSGWGVRTLSQSEVRYNPMSYHNGSVWPHDNALIAAGLGRYGYKERVLQILCAIFDAATYMDLYRLPELHCGFSRRPGEGPTLYPVACSPQAWAAASPFMLLKACLGLCINGLENRIILRFPVLPPFLTELVIQRLSTKNGSVDLSFRRHGEDVSVYVENRSGNVEVILVK